MHDMDLDGDGKVSYSEFMSVMLHDESADEKKTKEALYDFRDQVQKALKEHPENFEQLLKNFMFIDKDKDGFLSLAEIELHINSLKDYLTKEQLEELRKKDGQIDMDLAAKAFMAEIDHDGSGEVAESGRRPSGAAS